jgi:two-component system, NtrC family, response regulator HydG
MNAVVMLNSQAVYSPLKDGLDVTNSSNLINNILGECDAIKSICQQISQIAPTNCTVLISGDTGTGKGLVAQNIFDLSGRGEKICTTINCATPPETAIETEIFGHHRNSLQPHHELSLDQLRTLNGSTLLIDEISELAPECQAYFLEVLELIEKNNHGTEDPINVRLIITTQHDLKKLAQQNRFNQRLYYHLNIFTIVIPPLRDRGADKIKIAEKLLVQACKKYGKNIRGFSSDAISAMNDYHWPGNYRELRNTIERAVVLAQCELLNADQLVLESPPQDTPKPAKKSISKNSNDDAELSLEDYFQHYVLEHQEHMTETELAQKLGISRKCLWERRQKYGLPRKKGGNSQKA